MIEWFGQHYEDPVHRLPYNSREGGYQWINGGPYSADEVLGNEFGDIAKASAIEAAVDEIQAEGYDWSPKPEYEQDDGIYSINDPLPDISDFDYPDEEEDESTPTRADADSLRREMLDRLDRLESLIRTRLPARGGIGHNHPPEPLEDLPISAADLDDSLRIIQDLRTQADAPEPDTAQVLRSASLFRRMASTVGRWLTDRANGAVDATIGSLIPTSAALAAVAYGKQLVAALENAAASALEWLHATTPLF